MRYLILLTLAAASCLAGPEPECTTSLGIPCFTIAFDHTQYQLFFRSWSNLGRFHEKSTLAFRRDGSRAHQTDSSENLTLRGLRDAKAPSVWMYLAPSDRVVEINHAAQTRTEREPRIWHDRAYRKSKPEDTTCATGILHSGTDYKLEGESTMLGLRVFKWVRGDDEMHLAPALDCAPLKSSSIHRNRWGIPDFITITEATWVRMGEPDSALFSVPAHYAKLPAPPPNRVHPVSVQRSR